MWLVVMFDLPVVTKPQRRQASLFRLGLRKDGFQMLQYSVYGRCCPSEENTDVHAARILSWLPPEGEVRLIRFTDAQFARMQVFHGKRRKRSEKAPRQLEIF